MDPRIGYIAGLVAVYFGLFAVVLLVGSTVRERRQIARSFEAMENFRADPRAVRQQELEQPFADRVVGPIARRFVAAGRRVTPDERLARIRRRLDLAGNPDGWDVDRVLGLKALGLVVGALVGLAVPALLGAFVGVVLVTAVGLAVLGWFGPDMFLYQVAYNRSDEMRRELSNALDLLTISVEAGLAFDAALAQVARNTAGPLAAEFFRVLQEMQIGTGRLDALRALADRTDVEELRIFVGAMVQAESFGIPIANVLRIQSREIRVKRSQRAEEQAQKVPVKILFPLIFCILPTLFIVVIGPAALQMIKNLQGIGG
jgi:tight adherence protein C